MRFTSDDSDKVRIDGGIHDYHCHFRSGNMMKLVTKLHYNGGVRTSLVMPNIIPHVKDTKMARDYYNELMHAEPKMEYLSTVYLKDDTKPSDILPYGGFNVRAAKLYPRGATTNSDEGVKDIKKLYPVFKLMAEHNIVLCVHGECVEESDPLTAERNFLPIFENICMDFPTLKIVLEHCTTREAVDVVNSLGPNVAATITLHHLQITCSDWIGKNYGVNYCKPVAKYKMDREQLRLQVINSNKKFFLGTDSAPHTENDKINRINPPAGVFTGYNVAVYACEILESFGALDNVVSFTSVFGYNFYNSGTDNACYTCNSGKGIVIGRTDPYKIPEKISFIDESDCVQYIRPFMAGETANWDIALDSFDISND